MKKIAASFIAAAAAVTLAGCNWQGNMQDLEQVDFVDPDSVTAWNNVDGHPNIARSCLDGVAFATTTREYGDAVMRVPEWDDQC